MIIFEKYELNEQGQIKNINTGNFLKVEETANGRFVKVVDDGKTKRINLNDYINQGEAPQIEETNEEVDNQTVVNAEETQNEELNENSNNEQNNEEVQNEATEPKPKKSRKYKILVTEMDDTQKEFKTFKEANDFYGLRKDYLNYCITEKFQKMLDKVNLKKVEKVNIEE